MDDDPCQHKADAQRKEQVHERQRLPGQVIHVIGVARPGSIDVSIQPLDKGAEGTGVVSIGHEGGHLLAKVLDAGIRKGGDAVTAGGDVPFAVAYAHQQQHAVHIGAVAVLAVVIQIIGKLLHAVGTNAFHRLDGGNGHIEALAQAQLFQCVLQLVVLVLGQHLSIVEHAVVQVGKAALYRKGRNSQRRRKNQCCQRRKEGVQSVGSLFHRSSLLYRIRASHSSHITP